jgi:hypothetical protein
VRVVHRSSVRGSAPGALSGSWSAPR